MDKRYVELWVCDGDDYPCHAGDPCTEDCDWQLRRHHEVFPPDEKEFT